MAKTLLDHLSSQLASETPETPVKPKVLVELGASTMLPSLVAAFQHPEITCYATDLKKVMPIVEQSHQENERPANVVPFELCWGDQAHHEALSARLGHKPIDFIVCSDLIYDEVSLRGFFVHLANFA